MRLVAHWVPGDLPAAVAETNDRGWQGDVRQFVPGAKMIPYTFDAGGGMPVSGSVPQTGHYIVLLLSSHRADMIENPKTT